MSFVIDKRPTNGHFQAHTADLSMPKDSSLKESKNSNPAWHDSDDDSISVDINSQAQLKKLRLPEDLEIGTATNRSLYVDGTKYQSRLRNQFEKIHPTPKWIKPSSINGCGIYEKLGTRFEEDDDDELDCVHAFFSTKDKGKKLSINKIPVKNSTTINSIKYCGNITQPLTSPTVGLFFYFRHPFLVLIGIP